jgi:hypothetical protein
VDEVLEDKQRCWPVIELLAPVGADVDADLAAVRTETLGLGQFMMPGFVGQILRQATTTVRPAPPQGFARRGRFDRRLLCRVLACAHLYEQQELVGIEAFAARPIQAPQQQIDPLLQPLNVTITIVQRGQQFQDHALECGYIIGQVFGEWSLQVRVLIDRSVSTVGKSDRYPVICGQAETPRRVHDLRPSRCVDIDTVL